MAVHQCARFNANPMLCREKAVKYIARYLLSSQDKGINYKPDMTRVLECYVDAYFAGGWSSGDHTNPECVLSRTGFVIMYAGCPLTWCSKLQTEISQIPFLTGRTLGWYDRQMTSLLQISH